jgi:hypothetical protein
MGTSQSEEVDDPFCTLLVEENNFPPGDFYPFATE